MTMTDENAVACPDPVFVLCAGRSGSTLLRFLLDGHPVLTCPPETRIPWLCTQVSQGWSVIEDAPLNSADGAPAFPEPVLAGLRRSFEPMIASYLATAGKTRFCDKSLGAALHSPLLREMWPKAQFISLYRHPMDVIGSGIEAAPWGLSGYGFEPYVASYPGNSIAALASYWVDYTAAITEAEAKHGDACLRLRYEDLVADPEAEAKRLFGFLGVEAVPGITETIFARQRERSGTGDHKIWNTSSIGSGSVGRGWSIPARLIPPPLLAQVNGLAQQLGYLPVTPAWGQGDRPSDVRA
jgi:hypothetical protein